MANTTNDSHDIDIWFPDWLHVDWDDTNTCAYVTKLVNDFNFGLKCSVLNKLTKIEFNLWEEM